MDTVRPFLDLVLRLIWPLTVLVFLIMFKKELGGLLSRIVKLRVAAGKFKVETTLQQHVPPDVLAEVAKNPSSVKLNGERRNVPILYSEIQGFKSLAESLPPEKLAVFTNRYFTAMTEIVFRHKGTLDHYAGHALIAYWGAPIAYKDSASRACLAALEMLEALDTKVNPQLQKRGEEALHVAIAISTGTVVVGNFGSDQRFNYTILGETLDIMPPLCKLNRDFRTRTIVTEHTQQELGQQFKLRSLAEAVKIKGKATPIKVYELQEPA